jgi:MFS family permease
VREGWRAWWLRSSPLLLLFAAMMLGGFNYRSLVTALPTYLTGETARGGELARGGLLVFFALGVGGVGQFFGGWTADRFGAGRIYPWLIGMLVPFSILLGMLGGTPYAFVAACFLAVFLFAQQPVENSLMAEWTSAGRRSLSYGTKFALTFGVGAVGAYVVGLVWHHFNALGPAFYLIAVSAGVMGALAVASLAANRRSGRVPRMIVDATQPLAVPAPNGDGRPEGGIREALGERPASAGW